VLRAGRPTPPRGAIGRVGCLLAAGCLARLVGGDAAGRQTSFKASFAVFLPYDGCCDPAVIAKYFM